MSSAPGLSGFPEIQTPNTRGPQAWRLLLSAIVLRLPAGIRRSQRARVRMLRRIR